MQANLNLFYLISTSMSQVQPEENKNLDHLYSTHRDTCKALPRAPFGKSDHNSILLIPAYKQRLKQEEAVTRSIRKWSDDADATLQDCFASTDWKMFRDSANGIEEYTTSVNGFISKCIENVVPTVIVHTVHIPTRSHGLQATSAPSKRLDLPLSRSGTLIQTLLRNPAMPSDERSNRQSVNTGLRSNRTTPAKMW